MTITADYVTFLAPCPCGRVVQWRGVRHDTRSTPEPACTCEGSTDE